MLIKEFGPIDQNVIKEQYQNKESYVNQFLKSVNSAPNDHQTCIAAYAILKLNHSPSQMWELMGGMGKSRVIATMAFMLIEWGYSKVHIVLPTVALMNRDKEEFDDYWAKSNNGQKVEYHTNFDFTMEDGAIIISDEADHLMFNNP